MAASESTYETLPPECLLRIIAFLTLPDVVSLLRTSRLWNSVIVGNEQIVYHRLANNWDSTAIPLSSLGTALENWGSPNAKKIHTWKQYCQLQVATEKRWNGKGRSNSSPDVFGRAQRIQVHRIKIDTEKSLLVMSGQDEGDQNGSLVVHCLQDPSRQALFYLDQISIYAHVEMSNGFVVFTCGPEAPDSLEVWRWAEDQDACPLNSTPTAQQQQLYRDALSRLGHDSDRRGVLVPMGILKHSDETRASRMVYPTVCVGNRSGDCLSLWDVRTRKLTQTIDIEPSIYPRYRMSYVDVNETHVFVATHTVSVYSRATGQLVFHLDESHLAQITTHISAPTSTFSRGPVFTTRDLPGYTDSGRPMISGHRPWDVIVAVHVSPDGNDFVAITSRGHIFHISGLKVGTTRPDDETASHSPLRVRISATQAQNYLENLAYDGQRILAYGNMGLCLLNLEDRPRDPFMVQLGDGVVGELYPFPAKDVKLVAPFGGEGQYGDCSCLQMTRDTCWVARVFQSNQSRWHDLFGMHREFCFVGSMGGLLKKGLTD
ncbi:A Receptor for Ubiquitination Targets, partial [Rhizoctonia solani]